VVVVGGDAAGMSAASQALRTARRTERELSVTVLERGRYTSYSACGLPYWIAGDIESCDDLVARTPEQHRANGIDVRMGTEAVGLDLERRVVHARDADGGALDLPYHDLVLATGAQPLRPPIPGIGRPGVHGLQTIDDARRIIDQLKRSPASAVIVGGGYIGIEVAEALTRRGVSTTVVDAAPEPMSTLDHDMGARVHEAMEKFGIDVRTNHSVDAILGVDDADDSPVAAVVAAGARIPAELVVLGLGVRPATDLAKDAGLPLGDTGGIRVDMHMAVPGHPGVWAAGDCVESFDRVARQWVHVALGTHANKQGRVLGTNVGGGVASFPGVVRTAASKVLSLEIACTGLRERDATRLGLDCVSVVVESTTVAGYMPDADPIWVKLLAERPDGRLLGVQVVGAGPGSAKRIDACALALWHGMTARDLAMADLSYAPPFSPVWDPVQIAARKAADLVEAG
jgi:NADPH-dependent 2,4-dienoyl-CoA reductase/sulfur reductase-like enzyme